MTQNKPTKVIFLDLDLATLLSNIEETSLTPVACALFIQVVDRLIRKQPGRKKKSVTITMIDLHSEWFPFWSIGTTKRILQKLRRIGIIKTQMVYRRIGKAPQRFTRIWIDSKKISELAKQVQGEIEMSEMAKKMSKGDV